MSPTFATGLSWLESEWDVIIVGAGPAGASLAVRLANGQRRILLLDAKEFPRYKVCGGCLPEKAWRLLAEVGLTERLEERGAIQIKSFRLRLPTRTATWRLMGMHSVSRELMDWELIQVACERGVHFEQSITASVMPIEPGAAKRSVSVQRARKALGVVEGKVVVSADGLSHSSLRLLPKFESRLEPDSRIGIGVTIPESMLDVEDFPHESLSMLVGRTGYLGVAHQENGRINLAAAAEREVVQKLTPTGFANQVFEECRIPVALDATDLKWHGTIPLTRSTNALADERLFLVGDATGYVEPFTGEGMYWALSGAAKLQPFVEQALDHWTDEIGLRWQRTWRKRMSKEKWVCKGLAWLVRSPRCSIVATDICRALPFVPRILSRVITGVA